MSSQDMPIEGVRPDYAGGGIANLMASLEAGLGGKPVLRPATLLDPLEVREARAVVLVVIDGLGHEYLSSGSEGAIRARQRGRLTSVFPSTTASAVTTLLTGSPPARHAVTGWFTYLREVGAVVAPLPFRARFGGGSLADAGVDPAHVFHEQAMATRIRRRACVVLPDRLVDSCYTLRHSGSAIRYGYRSLRGMFRRITSIVRSREPSYVYAYWPDLDALAHHHGIGSRAVAAHLSEIDRAFDGFVRALAGHGVLVVLTADHGFVDCDPDSTVLLGDHPALEQTLMVPLCGEPRVAFCYVQPHLRSEFSGYVRERLGDAAALHASHDLIEAGLFGPGPYHPRLRERIGQFTLLMKGNRVIKDTVPGEKPVRHVGVHGGLSASEMYVPVVIAGPT